ncbi:MAG: hypothetical protein GY715_21615 [Planctomycetes bacterium]|nr:hypothetical protein [Planctomycetota bacterium]
MRPRLRVIVVLCLFMMGALAAPGNAQCKQGACGQIESGPCWRITADQCIAYPRSPTLIQGTPITLGILSSVDCDACGLSQPPGGEVDVYVGEEIGFSYCLTLGAGVTVGGGVPGCGKLELEASVTNEWCVDTKQLTGHTAKCRCKPRTLVHCVTIAEIVPLTIVLPIDYRRRVCYVREPGPLCQVPVNGITGLTQTIDCGRTTKTVTDTRLHIIASFQDGVCPPGTEWTQLEWEPFEIDPALSRDREVER